MAEACRKLSGSARTELAVLLGALADAGRTPPELSAMGDVNVPDAALPRHGRNT